MFGLRLRYRPSAGICKWLSAKHLLRICSAGFEPATFSSGAKGHPVTSENLPGVTSTTSLGCTSVSASEPENANKPAADPLADFVASLTAEQRQRLAALLAGKREGGDDA